MISVCSVSFGQSFEFAGEHPFKLGDDQGKIEITLDNAILRKGDGCPVHVKFTNTNGSYSVYNWQFASFRQIGTLPIKRGQDPDCREMMPADK